jgi:hypothetical protein
MTSFAELQAAANTFKLQYVCDQLYNEEQQQQQQQQAGSTAQAHLPGGPLSRGGSLELAARNQSENKQQQGSHSELQQNQGVAEQQEQQQGSDHSSAAAVESSPTGSSSSSPAYRTSWLQQYRALTWRECVKVTRNPADVAGRLLTFTWVALLVGLIYYDLPTDAGSIRQRLNLLFATLCFFVLMPFVNMSL